MKKVIKIFVLFVLALSCVSFSACKNTTGGGGGGDNTPPADNSGGQTPTPTVSNLDKNFSATEQTEYFLDTLAVPSTDLTFLHAEQNANTKLVKFLTTETNATVLERLLDFAKQYKTKCSNVYFNKNRDFEQTGYYLYPYPKTEDELLVAGYNSQLGESVPCLALSLFCDTGSGYKQTELIFMQGGATIYGQQVSAGTYFVKISALKYSDANLQEPISTKKLGEVISNFFAGEEQIGFPKLDGYEFTPTSSSAETLGLKVVATRSEFLQIVKSLKQINLVESAAGSNYFEAYKYYANLGGKNIALKVSALYSSGTIDLQVDKTEENFLAYPKNNFNLEYTLGADAFSLEKVGNNFLYQSPSATYYYEADSQNHFYFKYKKNSQSEEFELATTEPFTFGGFLQEVFGTEMHKAYLALANEDLPVYNTANTIVCGRECDAYQKETTGEQMKIFVFSNIILKAELTFQKSTIMFSANFYTENHTEFSCAIKKSL